MIKFNLEMYLYRENKERAIPMNRATEEAKTVNSP
jgi:hypothetical protein